MIWVGAAYLINAVVLLVNIWAAKRTLQSWRAAVREHEEIDVYWRRVLEAQEMVEVERIEVKVLADILRERGQL